MAVLLVVGVGAVTLAAVSGHVAVPQVVPVVQPAQAPVIVTPAEKQLEQFAPDEPYVMTPLPDAGAGIDLSPLVVLIVTGIVALGALWLWSKRHVRPITVARSVKAPAVKGALVDPRWQYRPVNREQRK
jgi:hypothetical protein